MPWELVLGDGGKLFLRDFPMSLFLGRDSAENTHKKSQSWFKGEMCCGGVRVMFSEEFGLNSWYGVV